MKPVSLARTRLGAWWRARNARERYLMLVACVLVTAAVLQVGYWPLQQRLGEARSEVAALSANARLMTEMQREIQRLQSLPVVTRLSPAARVSRTCRSKASFSARTGLGPICSRKRRRRAWPSC